MKKNLFFISFLVLLAGCRGKSADRIGEIEMTKIYNVVILDRSGSMAPLREVAVNGYNEILKVIRQAQVDNGLVQQNLVSLTLFNTNVTNVYDCDTINNIENLLYANYRPWGGTAMLDAIGQTLSELKLQLESLQNATAVVTIISDGEENSSQLYSVDRISQMIDELKQQGVMFVFMGTNQNVETVSSMLHIDNYRFFEYSSEGLNNAWEQDTKASADYYQRMSEYNHQTRNMTREERNAFYQQKNQQDGWFK